MKKTMCFILSLAFVVSTLSISCFAKEKCDCPYAPVIFVVGQGEDLYLNPGTENRKLVPDVAGNLIKVIPKLILGIIMQSIKGDYETLGSMLLSSAKDFAEVIACDKEGNSKYNVSITPEEFDDSGRHLALEYGENNHLSLLPHDYKFKYDWRLDPVYNAEILYDYIERVKVSTGHDKVVIMAHSEGNNVLCSYLYKYGAESFQKVMFLSPAYQGLSILGTLFSGEYSLDDKSDDIVTFLNTLFDDSSLNNAIKSSVSILEKTGLLKLIANDSQKLLDNVYEQKLYDYLIDVLGTMPGMWSFCPDEYYETAKHRAFDGKEGYEKLIEKIDYYHYNIQKNVPSLIKELLDNNVPVNIVAGYGISSIPVSKTEPQHSDMVIDTKYMSLGATCCKLGDTFEDGYVQQVEDSHNHISPDMMIDASTCLFPEITFFIRDIPHNDHPNEYCDFLWALAYRKDYCDVFSLEGYSQFMMYRDGRFVPVTGREEKTEQNAVLMLLQSLYDIVRGK